MLRKHRPLVTTALLGVLSLFLVACDTKVEIPNILPNSKYPEKGTPTTGFTVNDILLPEQPGTKTYESGGYVIDYSNASYGYLSIKAPEGSTQTLKAQVLFGDATYTYDLYPGEYVIVPLQQGTGTYTVRTLKNKGGDTYSVTASTKIKVTLDDELSPYLYPNQIVNYTPDTQAVLKSFELTKDVQSDIERVYEVYHFITTTITYDYDKAELAKTTFILPIIDETYIQKKGICFDYAALMTAMLRVQHIPTRVVTGITDLGYHAWVEVYIKDQGWINPSIYFNSKEWKRVDPTFDSMGSYDGSYQEKDYY